MSVAARPRATIRRRARSPAATACAGGSRCRGCWRSAFYFAFPRYLGFGTELLITILFAISLDLALGYAGIVTLGHAAFFGAGAYTVGMLAKHGIWTEPITGLLHRRGGRGARSGFASGLVLLRTTGLTLLMLTLCTMALLEEAANMGARLHRRLRRARQPADPAGVRHVRVQPALSQHAVSLRARRAVRLLRVRAHAGLFAVRPEPDRHPREHAAHARGRRAGAARGWSSATRSRRRSPASPARSGRRPTPTST